MRVSLCPHCGAKLDAATFAGKGEHTAKPGDWSICIYCTQMLVFDGDMTLRKPAEGEFETLRKEDPAFAKGLEYAVHVVRTTDRGGLVGGRGWR
jgi:hypothetical protein